MIPILRILIFVVLLIFVARGSQLALVLFLGFLIVVNEVRWTHTRLEDDDGAAWSKRAAALDKLP